MTSLWATRAGTSASPTPLWNFKSAKSWRCHREALPNRPLELTGTDNGTGILGGKEWRLPLIRERCQRSRRTATKPTKFETDKGRSRADDGRQAISPKLAALIEFSSLWSPGGRNCQGGAGGGFYLTPDRTKPITARKLGDDFDKVCCRPSTAHAERPQSRRSRPSHTHFTPKRDAAGRKKKPPPQTTPCGGHG